MPRVYKHRTSGVVVLYVGGHWLNDREGGVWVKGSKVFERRYDGPQMRQKCIDGWSEIYHEFEVGIVPDLPKDALDVEEEMYGAMAF